MVVPVGELAKTHETERMTTRKGLDKFVSIVGDNDVLVARGIGPQSKSMPVSLPSSGQALLCLLSWYLSLI
jgi:hypothetical protein